MAKEKDKKDKVASKVEVYKENLRFLDFIYFGDSVNKNIIKNFQEKYCLPQKELTEKRPWKWMGKDKVKIKVNSKVLDILDTKDRADVLVATKCIEKELSIIQKKIQMPIHFYEYLWDYMVYGVVSAPAFNFDFTLHKIDSNSKLIEDVSSISINIYSPISTEEKIMMFKLLNEISKTAFPNYISTKKKISKNLGRNLTILEEAGKRKSSEKKEIWDSCYLDSLYKDVQQGKRTKKEFNNIKRIHKNRVKIITKKGYSSKDIAKEVLKNSKSSDNIRQIVLRIKKEFLKHLK